MHMPLAMRLLPALVVAATGGAVWIHTGVGPICAAAAETGGPERKAPEARILEAQEFVLDVLRRIRTRPDRRATYERVLRAGVQRYTAMGVPENLLTGKAAREGVARALRKDMMTARGRQAARLVAKAERLGISKARLLPPRSEAEDQETLRLLDQLCKTTDARARAPILEKLRSRPMGGSVTTGVMRLCRETKDPQLRAVAVGLLKYDSDPAVDDFAQELLASQSPAQRRLGEELLTHARSSERIIPAVLSAYAKLSYEGRRRALDLLAGHDHRKDVQAFYLTSIQAEEHAVLSRTMASRLRVTDDRVASQLVQIATGKGEFSTASRSGAFRALSQTLSSSEAALKAVLAVLGDKEDELEVRLSALRYIERFVPSAAARQLPLTSIREGLAAVMASEEDRSRMQREIHRVLTLIDQASRGQLGRARAQERSVQIKRDYEQELARVQALLDGGGLPPEKVTALTKYRDRLRELIAGSELILLLSDPIGDEADRADKLKRVDLLLKQKLPPWAATKLLELREKLLLENGKRPDSGKAPRARE